MIRGIPNAFAHVAGQKCLISGVVRQNTGNNAAGTFCCGHTAQDHNELTHKVEHIIIEQDQIAVYDNGDKKQHHPHGNNCSEHAKALHYKRSDPLLEFSAVIQRHHADKRRCCNVQKDHIKDTRHTVDDEHGKIPYQLKRHRPKGKIVDIRQLEIL